ncbi:MULTISPECIES: ATP-binding protein [Oleiagrimonas]|nr:ATP-binding protein [Oleiagrimonas sp. MCCC 1A03011]
MHSHSNALRTGPRALARSLAWLRISAIAGQCICIFIVYLWLDMAIPLLALLIGVGALAIFAVFAAWRLQRTWPLSELECVGHILVDTLVLSYLLYLTGGASNPFITLMLVPIGLSAAALSTGAVLGVAVICGLAYLVLLLWSMPLPPIHTYGFTDFRLLVAGMVMNFIIMALLLGVFISRLAQALRDQQGEVQRIRERALRDEGILAIATQAASAAHEMNTPLSTMRTLLPELRREHTDDAQLNEDLELLQSQVERCRDSLREMVSFGKAQLSQSPEKVSMQRFVQDCLQRFRLLRPETDVQLTLKAPPEFILHMQPGLCHALINLLNNAADASASTGHDEVFLDARINGPWFELAVRDHGPGFADLDTLTGLGYTQKQTGLGLGLALAEATAERMDGELVAHNVDGGGEIRLRLPISVY